MGIWGRAAGTARPHHPARTGRTPPAPLDSPPMLPRAFHRLGHALALTATLFGGLVLGTGNMLALQLEPGIAADLHRLHGMGSMPGMAHERAPMHDMASMHASMRVAPAAHDAASMHGMHHAHAGAAPQQMPPPTGHMVASGPLPDLPAHCMFCIDGIAPQPVELILLPPPRGALRPPMLRAAATLDAPRTARRDAFHLRDPPGLTA